MQLEIYVDAIAIWAVRFYEYIHMEENNHRAKQSVIICKTHHKLTHVHTIKTKFALCFIN